MAVLVALLIGAIQDQDLTDQSGSVVDSQTAGMYEVVKVIDGDTIQVNVRGKTERIRLIGIDAPELVDPRRPVECLGREAAEYTRELLRGKNVRIETDPSQDERDRYGRLLAYVFLEDGTHVNLELIRQGYAHEYTYETPYTFQSQFKQAQLEAQTQQKGLWAPGACDINR